MTSDESNEERTARLNHEGRIRAKQLEEIPLQKIDPSKWPRNVRPIAIAETNGLGIDSSGRLHWDGRPVEIIGRRLDLTRTQAFVAIVVAVFTAIAAISTLIQAAVAYQDWACKTGRPSAFTCPKTSIESNLIQERQNGY
jgi:hypothetical protein